MGSFLVSGATATIILIGIIISAFYLRGMTLALRKAAAEIDTPDTGGDDSFSGSFLGAIFAVIASSLAIIFYGTAPAFLYLGIALALLSPIAVTYTLYRELRD